MNASLYLWQTLSVVGLFCGAIQGERENSEIPEGAKEPKFIGLMQWRAQGMCRPGPELILPPPTHFSTIKV